MPVYEFACQDCGHEFEELLLRRDEVASCPKCGSDRVHKLLSCFAVTGSARLTGSACSSCSPSPGKCSGCGSR
jgi:putative FmdB family regulatory protein